MCHVLHSSDGLFDRPSFFEHTKYRFFAVFLTDGFKTVNERALLEVLPTLAARLPLESCLVAHFFLPDEVRAFKERHGLLGLTAPVLFLSEDNPFLSEVRKRAVIQLGLLPSEDDVRRVVASIAEQAHDDNVIKKAKDGEVLRQIERALGKYGKPIKDCLKLVGL